MGLCRIWPWNRPPWWWQARELPLQYRMGGGSRDTTIKGTACFAHAQCACFCTCAVWGLHPNSVNERADSQLMMTHYSLIECYRPGLTFQLISKYETGSGLELPCKRGYYNGLVVACTTDFPKAWQASPFSEVPPFFSLILMFMHFFSLSFVCVCVCVCVFVFVTTQEIDGCTVVNPGHVTKGAAGGTYSKIMVSDPTQIGVAIVQLWIFFRYVQ